MEEFLHQLGSRVFLHVDLRPENGPQFSPMKSLYILKRLRRYDWTAKTHEKINSIHLRIRLDI